MNKQLLIISPTISGGGMEKVAVKIANYISDNSNYEVNIITEDNKPIINFSDGINLITLKHKRFIYNFNYLRKVLSNYNSKTILTHNPACNVIVSMINAFFFDGKFELIAVEHSTPTAKHIDSLKDKLILFFMKTFYQKIDKIVSVSKGSKKSLVSIGVPQNKITVINNPVYEEELKIQMSQPVEDFIFENNKKYFVTASRLVAKKRVHDIIMAFGTVLNHRNEVELIILGSGPQKERLKELAETVDQEKIHLLGYKNNPYKYLNKSNLFVMASEVEGLPLVLIEAMACGLNIVSTDCPSGPREILQDGEFGDLVKVGDIEALGEAMEHRLKNPIASQKLVERAQYFNTRNAGEKYLKVLAGS